MKRFAWTVVLVVLVLVTPARADEKVDASISTLRAQITGIHERILIVIPALDKAWSDFRDDPSPANEARINKLSTDLKTLESRRTELWDWLSVMRSQESMTVNTLRQILNETGSALDSAAQWARGVVPGATWILGVSKETLYNERWKDTEAAFSAMSAKGAELRRRYQTILSDLQNKVSDTPENREELANLEEEIALWKAKMQSVSEIYEFLRSDMPAEVIYWNELTGPYVKAFEENIKNNLEEILLWDTLGGTSPAERLYKLFKPVIQMKLGEYFSDPVLTDKVRNVIVMEVLFANAPLDRMLKSAETGVGAVLNSSGLQKAASELLGNKARRQELQGMLQQMSYDQIPGGARKYLGGAVPKPSGPIANFTVSGLSADEVKRLNKVKNSKAVADGIMKVAAELVGPLLNSGAFRSALETAKQECTTYRKVYRQLRAAKIVGAGTYVGIKGQAATSAEDNFVNECFEDPKIFAGYLEQLKGQCKGFDVAQYSIKNTYRKKPVEVENDVPGEPVYIESSGYEENTKRLQELGDMLWSNQIAAAQVYAEVKNAHDGLWDTYSKKCQDIKNRFISSYKGKAGESCIWDYSGPMSSTWGCPADFLDTVGNEYKSYCLCASTFNTIVYKHDKEEIPGFIETYKRVKDQATFAGTLLVPGDKTRVGLIKTQDRNLTADILTGPDTLNDTLWWNASGHSFQDEISRIEEVANEPRIPLKGGGEFVQKWINSMDTTISVLEVFLKAKQKERQTVLDLCPDLENIAEALGEHRNFYQYVQGLFYEHYELLRTIDVDKTIQRLAGYEERFSVVFDERYTAFQDLLERLKDRRQSAQAFAMIYSSSEGRIWELFDPYQGLYEEIYDGYYIVQHFKVDTVVALFEQGISTNQEGSIYIESLVDELSTAALSDAQIDSITDNGLNTFVLIPNVPLITHPVLRAFVTPSLERIEKARDILWQDYAEQDQLMQQYRNKEAQLREIEDELSRCLRALRNASMTAAPAFCNIASMESLQSTRKMKIYDVWPDVPAVESFTSIPDVLIKEINSQERALMRYYAFIDKIRQNAPMSAEQTKAVQLLEALAKQVDETGPGWLKLPTQQFMMKINEINTEAYKIYASLVQAGKARPDGPVNIAYEEVLIRVNLLSDRFYATFDPAEIIDTLRTHIADVENFISDFSTAEADIAPWISMLEQDIQPGSDADTLRKNTEIARLITKIHDLTYQLRDLLRQQEAYRFEKIREFYRAFKDAYEAKNESLVMSFLSDDWEAGDGTTLDDLEDNLRNSFTVFDEIRYAISNMNIVPNPGGTYLISYDVTITGRIFEMNMKHEEKSIVNEQIVIDHDKMNVAKTLGGRFWYVE